MGGGGELRKRLFVFQQGIKLYHGFHIIEALASFDKSTRFDSGFAMGYWGKALAYGPNINDYGYAASPAAQEAAYVYADVLSHYCRGVADYYINFIDRYISCSISLMRVNLFVTWEAMITGATFAKMALSFAGTEQVSHFDRIGFKVTGRRMFATYLEKNNTANVFLTPEEQAVFCEMDAGIYPVPNKWGEKGATTMDLDTVPKNIVMEALLSAYGKVMGGRA